MARPPRARERVLDAFETLLIDEGERAATLEATAKAADVSKGGLLYHFASKDELADGLIERATILADDDLERMSTASDGPVSYFLRTSIMEGSPLDRALIAVSRLAQSGVVEAGDALRRIRRSWSTALRPHVRDDTALDLVMLVSDGLYYNNALDAAGDGSGALAAPVPEGEALNRLIALVLDAVE
ncbi:TetR/AcrR family transcriptional regulator [Microbacterium pseudoresistens]|uniref:AcrR family transcriptional regulator n=1 Tax=Microbacterium pseudoresistens TaxID=640634 RepID=A0A7Y9JNC5_9MICO|nr:TetR/AcrR family transcriptional regulator [Microbacterium pseudoresistens]NYD55180.1 AcrR family transcriptional regulator [Microbacterium pseudoresistens]